MSRRIKVVFSIGGMHGGGSERQMVSLLRNIDRDLIEPLVFLVYRTGPLLQEIPEDIPVVAFEERYRGSQWPGLLMHGRRVRDMMRYFSECQADVSYDRTFLMTLIAADAAQRSGIPNVSTIVTDPPVGFGTVAGRFQGIKRRRLGRLYRQSTQVLANSASAARSAEQFYQLRSGLVATHHNGVDLAKLAADAETVIDNAWWDSPASPDRQRFRMVTAGRLNEKKGFHLLIDAIHRLIENHPATDFRLAILGDGPSRQELQQQITSLNLQESVLLTGFQPQAAAWYNSADLFVLPSFLEGMPNVLLEAMACGIPVLSTDCQSGPREILDNGKYGELCLVGSVDALVQGIEKFVRDRKFGQQFTTIGRQRIETKFSIQTAAGKLEEILLKAANHPYRS